MRERDDQLLQLLGRTIRRQDAKAAGRLTMTAVRTGASSRRCVTRDVHDT